MRDDIGLGRVQGFPLSVHWSVLVILWLLAWNLATALLPDAAPGYSSAVYWTTGVAGALLLIGSLLTHELAHAVVARRAGIEVKGLTLWVFGGVASLGAEADTPQDDLRIAIVGPATSVGLAAGFGVLALLLGLLGGPQVVVSVLAWLSVINLVLAVFNLVPGAPLDGGRVLRALLWRRLGDRVRAALTATRAGQGVAYGLIWLGLIQFLASAGIGGLWLVLIGWFVLNAARAEEADIHARDVLAGVRVAEVMSPRPQVGPAWLTVDSFIDQYVLGNRYSAYPVASVGGKIVGLVSLEQLRAVPPDDRARRRIADVAIPLADVPVASPEESVVALMGRMGAETGGRALVFHRGELVGIITGTDIARTLAIGSLRSRSDPRARGLKPTPVAGQ